MRECDGTCDTCELDCYISNRGYENFDMTPGGPPVDQFNRCQFCGDFYTTDAEHGYSKCYNPPAKKLNEGW